MLYAWLKKRRAAKAAIVAEAAAMIREFGDTALCVSRDLAAMKRAEASTQALQQAAHWDQVRFTIRKLTRMKRINTDATHFTMAPKIVAPRR